MRDAAIARRRHNVSTTSYFDGTAAANTEYVYHVQAFDQGLGVSDPAETGALWSPSSATPGTTLIHNRGKVLVIVEGSLMTQTGSSFVAFQQKLLAFQKDLAGDGWEVVPKTDAPRHMDKWDQLDQFNHNNAYNIGTIKSWINSNSSGTVAVILIGHVPIPYSGSYTPLPSTDCASDGHSDHATAWTADIYYGDVNVTWPAWAAPNSLAGQFTLDFTSSPIELAVGRIDFARLTAFGVSDPFSQQPPPPPPYQADAKEADLLVKYLTKDHNYRVNMAGSPFPLPQKGMSYISWGTDPDPQVTARIQKTTLNCKKIITDLFDTWDASRLYVGEPLRNGSPYRSSTGPLSYLFAFAGGNGGSDQIYNQRYWDLDVETDPVLKNTTAGPASAFWVISGSYFTDFNMGGIGVNPNNLPRSILATGDYSLIVVPNSGGWTTGGIVWNLTKMSWGRTFGEAFVDSLNDHRVQNGVTSVERWRCILGDPTLRLNTVLQPTLNSATITGGSSASLNFSGGETSSYYIYRSASMNGPFSLMTQITGAQTAYPVAYSSTQPYYMVRCGKLVNSGGTDYTSLSQGDIKQAQ